MGLTAAAGFGLAQLFTRLGTLHVDTLPGAVISTVPSFLLSLTVALSLDLPAFVEVPLVGFLWMALLAVINYPLGRVLDIMTTSRLGAARSATVIASAPIWSAILAISFLGERPNAAIVVGTIAVVVGVAVIVREARTNESRVTTATRTDPLGYLFGLGTGVCYGAMPVLSKTAVSDYAPPQLVAAITVGMGVVMVTSMGAPGIPRAFRSSRNGVAMFALSGLFGGAGLLSIMFGVKHSDVVIVTPIMSISPLVTLILVSVFLRRLERITVTLVLGTLVVVTGAVLVAVGGTT